MHHLIMLLCSAVIGWNSMAVIGPAWFPLVCIRKDQKKNLSHECELLKQFGPHLNQSNFKLVTVIN